MYRKFYLRINIANVTILRLFHLACAPYWQRALQMDCKERCWITIICCLAAGGYETQWSVYRPCHSARIYPHSTNYIVVCWRCRRRCHRRFSNVNSLFNQQSREKKIFCQFSPFKGAIRLITRTGEARNIWLSVLPYNQKSYLFGKFKQSCHHLAHISNTEWEILLTQYQEIFIIACCRMTSRKSLVTAVLVALFFGHSTTYSQNWRFG